MNPSWNLHRMRRVAGRACAGALAGLALWLVPPASRAGDQQGWYAAFVNGPVSSDSRLLAWIDGHARFRDDAEHLDVTILRPGVGWRIGSKLDLWVGYARITTRRAGPDIDEERAWQQATYPVAEWMGGRFTGRTRLEQRFRDSGGGTGWRLRQFVRYGRPLAGSDFGLVASNEVFVSLNDADWGQRDGFDQNRAFVGAYYQPGARVRIEGGYLNQFIRGIGRAPDRRNDNLALSVFVVL